MELVHRLRRILLDLEIETRGELDGAHHAHRILPETDHRISDGTDDPLLEILETTNPVYDRKIADVVEESIDGEITTVRIRLRSAERIVLKRTFCRMLDDFTDRLGVLTECGSLNDLTAKPEMGKTETTPDKETVAERTLHLVGLCAGADIEILRIAPQKQITHTSTDKVCRVAKIVETVQHTERIPIDILARNAMIRTRPNDGLVLLGLLSA